MKENRIKKIFEILTEDYKDYTANEIANRVDFSSKTVRNDIKDFNKILKENGAYIRSKAGVGFRFIIKDKDKFSNFIQDKWPKYALNSSLNSQEHRVNYIILKLVLSKDYIKSDMFQDDLYISKSQVNQDLKLVRKILKEHNLSIEAKPHYGMKIIGKEINIRNYLVKYIEENTKINKNILEDLTSYSPKFINKIKNLVLILFRNYGFDTNLVKYNNFINYLIISIFRIDRGNKISNDDKTSPIYEEYSSIYKLSLEIGEKINDISGINVDEKETEYIYINLISKLDYLKVTEYNEDSQAVIDRTLMAIKNTISIDLTDDSELKSSLLIHLNPMIKRIKYGIKLKNPLLNDIKKDHLAVECAKICSFYLNDQYKINISPDELGYISLHFSGALAKRREKLNKKNILLVCASGRATAQVLKYRFRHEFSKYINKLDVSDYLMAISMDLNEYDLIITTIPLSLNTDVPIVEVSAYLYEKDIDNVMEYLKDKESFSEVKDLFKKDLFFKVNKGSKLNYKAILKKMTNKAEDIMNIEKADLYKQVIKREELAATSMENKVAMPHPLKPVSDKNFLGILVSDDEIEWLGQKVNVIILINLNENLKEEIAENFYKLLSKFLSRPDKILKASESNNLEEFLDTYFSL